MTNPSFHDAHAHALQDQKGGFLIAMGGTPVLPGTLSNTEVAKAEDRSKLLFGVPYATNQSPDSGLEGALVKYHPRREGFDAKWVADDIARYSRRLVLIDTLNAIHWPATDYLKLAQRFTSVQFLMCHAGGYDALEFVKMCRFMKNVWIDFSATQHIFGWAQGEPNLPSICDLIDHSLHERRIASKVMFGSDNPEFAQHDAVARLVARAPNPEAILRTNFESLIERAGLG